LPLEYRFTTSVKIYPHGGKILYPKITYYLTFKSSDEIMGGSLRLIEATPVITERKKGFGGPWTDTLTINDDQRERIEYLFLALECYDQLMREYFTIARFKFVNWGWAWNRTIIMTKRKQWWKYFFNKRINLFKKIPSEWIKKYGERGILLEDWSERVEKQ